MPEKFSLMPLLMASIAESIPTSAVMPMLMISMVIIALRRFALMAFRAMRMFSRRKVRAEGSKLEVQDSTLKVRDCGKSCWPFPCLYFNDDIPGFHAGLYITVSIHDLVEVIVPVDQGFKFSRFGQFFNQIQVLLPGAGKRK